MRCAPLEVDACELEVMRLTASSSIDSSSGTDEPETSLGAYLDSVGLS